MFQGAPDRAAAPHEVSHVDVGGAAVAGAGMGPEKIVGYGAKDTAEEGAKLAEALGGGGAFSVEHELARIQGELTALLS